MDADRYRRASQFYLAYSGVGDRHEALEALDGAVTGWEPVVFETEDELDASRSLRVVEEYAAGGRFCITNGGFDFGAAHDRNLPYQAAAHGLPHEEALKAVTLSPARILGVVDPLGSLEAGKDATLLITNDDPLEVTTQVEAAFIDGRPVDLTNRQTRLYEKYRQKYAP